MKYQNEIDVIGNYDVVIAGSGPAGICAAKSAALAGASVALIERYGDVGGALTTGFVGPILGMVGAGSMRHELVNLLGVPENDMIGESGRAHDFESAKYLLANFVDMDNIDVFLQTDVCDVVKEDNVVKGLVVSTNENLKAILGHTIIDCTGDGKVCYLAGADIEKGRDDGLCQPVSLEFTISGVDEERALICIGDVDEVKIGDEKFLDYCERLAHDGELPESLAAVRLHPTVRVGERQVNTTQVNGVDNTKVQSLFKTQLELRHQMNQIVDFLKKHVPGYENCYIKASGTTLGVRESRRVMGDYVLQVEDEINGVKFDDVVVHDAEFIVDIHNPEGAGQADDKIQYVKPYDIPYRCFLPRGLDNLMVAGRCISGTHRAHASYRVMSICMAGGEAVGIAAALASKSNIAVREVNVKEIQNALKERGVEL
ncbi:MAG: FAD-dependent oxidoreductase [Coriobacteriia bacterium]|nr:FAD-dependent oxidoreductase [Coriobacteriia bacterium]